MNKFTSGSHEIILKRIRDIPSLPEVVNRIILQLGEPNTPASEIARLISYDPGLTSKVLRMVNSAAYGFQRQISSIQHGIMLLGFNTVRGLVLSASIFKLFEGQSGQSGLDHKQFWEHSLGTALAARLIAKSFRMQDADDAFSAGMLHDIGKVVLDTHFLQDYLPVLEMARRQKLPFHGAAFLQLETDLLGANHTDIGNYLAAKWRLPVAITEAIQYHHAPQAAPTSQPLVYLVALANQLATLQYEHQGVYDRAHFSADVLEYFQLEDEDIETFLTLLREDIESAEELLSSISNA